MPDFANSMDPVLFWTLAVLCAMLVGFAKSGVAGAGILAVPLMAMVFPAKQSPGILLPMLIVGDILAVIYYKKHAEWKHVLRALPWAFAGIIAGWATIHFTDMSPTIFKRMLGGIVMSMLLIGWWLAKNKKDGELEVPSKWWFAALIGIIGGFTTMAANAAGPIFAIYFLSLNLPVKGYLGTSGWTFLILNSSKVPFSAALGFITLDTLRFNLMMIPAIIAGAFIGMKIVKKLPQDKFALIVKILTGAAAAKLLFA